MREALRRRAAAARPLRGADRRRRSRRRDRDGAVRALRGTGRALPPLAPGPRDRRRCRSSFAQERLWFLDQLRAGHAAYNMPGGPAARGRARAGRPAGGRSARSCAATRRCAPPSQLRGGRSRSRWSPAGRAALPRGGPRGLPAAAREAGRAGWPRRRPPGRSTSTRGPLLRAAPAAAGRAPSMSLLLAMHHIVSDGWSMGVLVREIAALYEAAVRRAGPRRFRSCRSSTPTSRSGSAAGCSGEVLARQLGYWRERLAGAAAALDLPTDRPRPAAGPTRGGRSAPLPSASRAELASALRPCAARGATPVHGPAGRRSQALLGASPARRTWWSARRSPAATGRELEPLIGFFVNTLVLRGDLAGDPPFRELLGPVRRDHPGGLRPPGPALREAGGGAAAASATSGDAPAVPGDVRAAERAGRRRWSCPASPSPPLERSPATAQVRPRAERPGGAGLAGLLALRQRRAVRRRHRRSGWPPPRDAVPRALAGPRQDALGLPCSARRSATSSCEWNDTRPAGEPRTRRSSASRRRPAATPEAVALEAGGERLTYGELDRRADRLAHRLRRLGVGPEVRSACSLERCAEMVVGLLGDLEGRRAPMCRSTRAYPAERLAYLLEDSGVRDPADRAPTSPAAAAAARATVVCLDAVCRRTCDLAARVPGGAARPGRPGLRDLHLGLNRPAQGRRVAHGSLARPPRWYHGDLRLRPGGPDACIASFTFDIFLLSCSPRCSRAAPACLAPDGARRGPRAR